MDRLREMEVFVRVVESGWFSRSRDDGYRFTNPFINDSGMVIRVLPDGLFEFG